MLVSNALTAVPSLNKQWDKAFHKAASGECSRPWAPGEVGLFQKFYLFTEHSLCVREHNISLNYSSVIYEAVCFNILGSKAHSQTELEQKWGLGKELIDWLIDVEVSLPISCVGITGNKRRLGFWIETGHTTSVVLSWAVGDVGISQERGGRLFDLHDLQSFLPCFYVMRGLK